MGLKHHGRERKWSTTRFRTWSDPRGTRTLPNSVLHLPRSSTSRDCRVEAHLSPTFNVLNRAMRRVSILGQSPCRSIAIAGPVLKADDETLRPKAEANGRSWSSGSTTFRYRNSSAGTAAAPTAALRGTVTDFLTLVLMTCSVRWWRPRSGRSLFIISSTAATERSSAPRVFRSSLMLAYASRGRRDTAHLTSAGTSTHFHGRNDKVWTLYQM